MPVSFCKMLSCCAALILLSTLTSSVNVIETELEPLPTDANYKAGETNYDNGGMGPLYDFSRSFINSALPEFPTDFIKSVMDDGIGYVTSDPTGVIKKFAGYAIAIVIGLLFVLIMPIVGCCFCCCRMCGNCGGKREQEADDNMHCKRRVFSAILFTTTIFIFVGNICTYVANDQMSNALEEVNDIVGNNLDDVDTFLDLLESQVTTIGETNMNKTRDAITDKMNATRMADDLTLYVLAELSGGALDKMITNKERVIKAYESFKTENARMEAAVPSAISPNPFLTVKNSLTAADSSITNFTTNDPIAQVKLNLVNEMKGKLSGDMNNQNAKVTAAFATMGGESTKIVQQIRDLRHDAKGSLNVDSIKDTVRSYTDSGKTFDGYRRKAGLGLSAMTTLVAALLALGMVFGTVGQGLRTEPTERGSVSSCGGHFLIAGVAFVFIFSSLLMLLTTLCFALGAPLERFLCQPLTDPDMKLLKEFETRDSFKSVADTLGGSITSSLKACKDGKSAYEAFHLKKRFDLDQIDQTFNDQKKSIDASLNKTLGSITGLTTGDLENKATNSFADLEHTFDNLHFPLMDTAVTQGQQAGLDMSGFKGAVDELKAIKAEIPTWKTDFTDGMKKAQGNITAQLPTLLGKFKNEVIHIAEVFVTSTKKSLLEDVGKCTPVWNLYHSIIGVAVCQYIIDAFNGFWFSIGWCLFFFVPSLIFAVKLAKHYRSVDPEDQPFENKVGPSPDEVEARY
ncbi:prominin-1-A-like [Mya arenaria]|uniref:prominin-1-A-like n=1 Tax=Mya arenaria TaxID=6604 RepID=UPI0022E0194B|nr:prominin-1-A-like [Mya arenaria]